jgi:hypothetical protein
LSIHRNLEISTDFQFVKSNRINTQVAEIEPKGPENSPKSGFFAEKWGVLSRLGGTLFPGESGIRNLTGCSRK